MVWVGGFNFGALAQAASAAGSWAGPGPGPDRLGLKCYLAWGGTRVVVVGGERGNFMYLNHKFSLVTATRILNAFVHTNFPIRVFWQRWDKTNILQMTRLLVCRF